MYLFILPGFVYFVVFRCLPLLGNVVAFQDYSPCLRFLSSEWVGLQNFVDLFNNPDVAQALANTVIINGLQLIFFFPAPIALAAANGSSSAAITSRIAISASERSDPSMKSPRALHVPMTRDPLGPSERESGLPGSTNTLRQEVARLPSAR